MPREVTQQLKKSGEWGRVPGEPAAAADQPKGL
jgi:hypothetical protein